MLRKVELQPIRPCPGSRHRSLLLICQSDGMSGGIQIPLGRARIKPGLNYIHLDRLKHLFGVIIIHKSNHTAVFRHIFLFKDIFE